MNSVPGAGHLHSGKVRDVYQTDDGSILLVASDRISAYDFVLQPDIPDKGVVLTQLSLWWFDQIADIVPNHVRSNAVPEAVRGRAMLCERLDMFPVECVARGYLTGSGLADYQRSGHVCAVPLPAGLVDASQLPEPIFTPATKAELGEHDENISFEQMADLVGMETAETLRDITLRIYARAERIARERGIILADTKFEFGRRSDGTIVLADEALTPDSSRFWPAASYEPGQSPPSFDKQYVRDWLASPDSNWDRNSDVPPPQLPDDVVANTRSRYIQAFEALTGTTFEPSSYHAGRIT